MTSVKGVCYYFPPKTAYINKEMYIIYQNMRAFKRPLFHYRYQRAINDKGYNGIIIYGKKGSGKSTKAMIDAYDILGSWDEVLGNIFFTRQQLMEKLRPCFDMSKNPPTIKYRYPVLIWDDAGHENAKGRSYDQFIEELGKFMQLIRSVVANFFWTLPNPQVLKSIFKSDDWGLIRVVKNEARKNYFECRYYKYLVYPSGKVITPAIRRGDMGLKDVHRYDTIPKEIRAKYEMMRDSYSGYAFLDLQRAFSQSEEKQEVAGQVMAKFKNYLKSYEPET